jgi:hypothetical protein
MPDDDKAELVAAALELVSFMEREASGRIFDDDEVWGRFKQAVSGAASLFVTVR